MLLGAALGISIEAVREIRTPHHMPKAWTLAVLVVVMAVKWTLSRRVGSVGADIGSTAVTADAWHHIADAITSAAAVIGTSTPLLGRPGGESADHWAALFGWCCIAFNGAVMV